MKLAELRRALRLVGLRLEVERDQDTPIVEYSITDEAGKVLCNGLVFEAHELVGSVLDHPEVLAALAGSEARVA